MKRYEVLKGSFMDRYFGDYEKGTWYKISYLKYLWLKILDKKVRIIN